MAGLASLLKPSSGLFGGQNDLINPLGFGRNSGGFDLFSMLGLGEGGGDNSLGGLDSLITLFGGSTGGGIGGGPTGFMAGLNNSRDNNDMDISSLFMMTALGGGNLDGLFNGGGSDFLRKLSPRRNGGNLRMVDERNAPDSQTAPGSEESVDVAVNGDGPQATIEGDPHFMDWEGGKYDVMGKPGEVYTMISDKSLHYNARFDAWGSPDATILGAVGLKIGDPKQGVVRVEFDKEGIGKVNGKQLQKGQVATFDSGLRDEKGRRINAKAYWEGDNFVVVTGEYKITYTVKTGEHGKYIDQKVQATNLGPKSDGVASTGLLGSTLMDPKANNGKTGQGAQGEGAIVDVVGDYKEAGLFSSGSKYTKFGTLIQDIKPELGYGTGKTATTY